MRQFTAACTHLCWQVDFVAEDDQPLVQAQRGHWLQDHAAGGAHVLAVLLEGLSMFSIDEVLDVFGRLRYGESTCGLSVTTSSAYHDIEARRGEAAQPVWAQIE